MPARGNESVEQEPPVDVETTVLAIRAKTVAWILLAAVLLITLTSLAVRFLQ